MSKHFWTIDCGFTHGEIAWTNGRGHVARAFVNNLGPALRHLPPPFSAFIDGHILRSGTVMDPYFHARDEAANAVETYLANEAAGDTDLPALGIGARRIVQRSETPTAAE